MNCPDCDKKMIESVFVEDTLEIRNHYCEECNAFFNEREGSLEYFMTPAKRRKKQVDWISVDERLPNEHNWYLVCYGGKCGEYYAQRVHRAFYEKGFGWEKNEVLSVTWKMRITHWTPLPAPPEKK